MDWDDDAFEDLGNDFASVPNTYGGGGGGGGGGWFGDGRGSFNHDAGFITGAAGREESSYVSYAYHMMFSGGSSGMDFDIYYGWHSDGSLWTRFAISVTVGGGSQSSFSARFNEPPNARTRIGYIDGNVGYGLPVGPVGVGPTVGMMYDLENNQPFPYVGGALSWPPGMPTGSLNYSPYSVTPGLNISVSVSAWGLNGSGGIAAPFNRNGLFGEGGVGLPGASLSLIYVWDTNRRHWRPNSATNSNGNPNNIPPSTMNNSGNGRRR